MDYVLQKLLTGNILLSLVIVIIAVAVIIFLGNFRKKATKSFQSLQDPKVTIIRRITIVARVLVAVVAAMTVCQVNGINISSVIAGLGIAGAVVGLALQDYLKDIIMGVHIISDKFFGVGDCVRYNGRDCVVVGFSLTSTKIGDLSDHSVTTVCNRNISEMQKLRDRFTLDIPLSYDEKAGDVHKMMQEISELISNSENVNKCEFLGTQEFEDSAIKYRLLIFSEPQQSPQVRRDALYTVQRYLADKGVTIPFNQLDVHINK